MLLVLLGLQVALELLEIPVHLDLLGQQDLLVREFRSFQESDQNFTILCLYFNNPGFIGASGATGASGDTGSTGSIGSQGTSGATGFTGATGSTGPSGSPGGTGSPGQQGKTEKFTLAQDVS